MMELKYNRPKEAKNTLMSSRGTSRTHRLSSAAARASPELSSLAIVMNPAETAFSSRTPTVTQVKVLASIKLKQIRSRKALLCPPSLRPQTAAYKDPCRRQSEGKLAFNRRCGPDVGKLPRPFSAIRAVRAIGEPNTNGEINASAKKKLFRVHSNERQITIRGEKENKGEGQSPRAEKPYVMNIAGNNPQAASSSSALAANYHIGRQIGKGAYAIVKELTRKSDGQRLAVKIYEKIKLLDQQRRRNVSREIHILQRLDHPNIVRMVEAVDGTKQLCLVLELVKGGSLCSYVKSRDGRGLDEAEARRIFRQVLSGIRYCHGKGVSHRDIKLENILLDEHRNVKIIDFGFSACTPSGARLHMFCGTPSYMAPEIVAKRDYCGPPADVWALGIVLFTMLVGRFPFKGATEKELFRCISRGLYATPVHVSVRARALIGRMLQMDPQRRPSCEALFRDPFLVDWSEGEEVFPGVVAYATAGPQEYNGRRKAH